jgi:hypothetical protein
MIVSDMIESDNIVLEHLRHIRGVVDGTRDGVRELKHRVGLAGSIIPRRAKFQEAAARG